MSLYHHSSTHWFNILKYPECLEDKTKEILSIIEEFYFPRMSPSEKKVMNDKYCYLGNLLRFGRYTSLITGREFNEIREELARIELG